MALEKECKKEKPDIYGAARRVWDIESEQIARLKDVVSREQFERAAALLEKCKGKIILSGCGTSGAAAKKAAHSLCCVERPACYLSPADAPHGALGMLQEEDILILISKGGGTQELIPMAKAAVKKNAAVILVTENENAVLAPYAAALMRVSVEREAGPFNMLATASTMAVVAVFDAICVALMQITGYTKEQFLTIHPGGAVGGRLKDDTREREERKG